MNAERFFDCPTPLEPPAERRGLYAKLATPLRVRLRGALERSELAGAPVVGLLHWIFPAHIAKLIVALVVNSPKRKTNGTFPEVGNEQQEVMPTFAHLDAPPAITRVGTVLGVVAARHHKVPRLVRSCPEQPMYMVALGFLGETAARARSASEQVLHECHMWRPTLTQARPITASTPPIWRAMQHLQPPKPLSFKFSRCTHV